MATQSKKSSAPELRAKGWPEAGIDEARRLAGGAEEIELTRAQWFDLADRFIPRAAKKPTPPAIDRSDQSTWTLGARIVAKLRTDEDRGLGDTLHRCLDALGGGTLAEWYTKLTGRSCGCRDRQADLNVRFPY